MDIRAAPHVIGVINKQKNLFSGQLVSAKFLRDERYEQRFPNAPH